MSNVYVMFSASGFGLGKRGDFTTNVDAENQTLINHKCVCRALNRHFFVGVVSGSLFSSTFQVVYLWFIFSLTKNSFTDVQLMYEYLLLSYF